MDVPKQTTTLMSPPPEWSIPVMKPVQCSSSIKPVVGTSSSLSKQYSRPCAAPNMSSVRPEPILQQAFLLLLQQKYDDLEVLADELKSIRQDLTIQHIDNAFSATVYEVYTRLAIELNHWTELGQCFTIVHKLHARGIVGSNSLVSRSAAAPSSSPQLSILLPPANCANSVDEFAMLRVIYAGLVSTYEDNVAFEVRSIARTSVGDGKGGGATRGSSTSLMRFAVESVNCKHNPVLFLACLHRAPTSLVRQLLRIFLPRLRLAWLRTVVNGFEDFLSESMLVKLLGFSSEGEVCAVLQPVLKKLYRGGFRCSMCRKTIVSYIDDLESRDKK